MKKCFTCAECSTINCPNIQYEAVDDRYGFGIADDMGLKRVDCANCRYMTGKCEDCLFFQSRECHDSNDDF